MSATLRVLLLATVTVAGWVVAYRAGIDFPAYYKVMCWLADGEWQKVYAADGAMRWFYYPPVALALFLPWGYLSFGAAKALWLVGQTLSVVVLWLSLEALYPWLDRPGRPWAWLVVYIAAINPIHTSFQCLNLQLVLAATLFLCEWLASAKQEGRQFAGGFLCAFVGSIKVYPLFIAGYYLLFRPGATRRGVIGGLACAAFLPFLVFGREMTLDFYRGFLANLSVYHGLYTLAHNPENLSLPSALAVWIGENGGARIASQVISVLVGICFLGVALRARRSGEPRAECHAWALAAAVMALLNSTSRPDHTVFYLPAFASALEIASSARLRWGKAGITVALLLIAFTAQAVVGSRAVNDQLELWRVPVAGMIVLCLSLAVMILTAAVSAPQSPIASLLRGEAFREKT